MPRIRKNFFDRLSSLIHDAMYVNAHIIRRQDVVGFRPHIKNPSKLQTEAQRETKA